MAQPQGGGGNAQQGQQAQPATPPKPKKYIHLNVTCSDGQANGHAVKIYDIVTAAIEGDDPKAANLTVQVQGRSGAQTVNTSLDTDYTHLLQITANPGEQLKLAVSWAGAETKTADMPGPPKPQHHLHPVAGWRGGVQKGIKDRI